MNYDPNTTQWHKHDLVLHDADAKEPRMLMKVIGYTRDGLCKTQYITPDHRRTVYKNRIAVLHEPTQWLGKFDHLHNLSADTVQHWHDAFVLVRRWNLYHEPGQMVVTTSGDGGFYTQTQGKAIIENGQAHIYLKYVMCADGRRRGGMWNLFHVAAVSPERIAVEME